MSVFRRTSSVGGVARICCVLVPCADRDHHHVGNELSGTVSGLSVQAGVIGGDVHLHGSDLLAQELIRVQRQLVESMRAERDITQIVWVLQTVLLQLQQTIARLTHEREQRDRELAQARQRQVRTELQLDRANAERASALQLVETARARVLALETSLRGAALVEFPDMDVRSLDIGLDMVDQYLDRQGERLEQIHAELAEDRSAERLLDAWLNSPSAALVAVAYCEPSTPSDYHAVLGNIPRFCTSIRFANGDFVVLCSNVSAVGGGPGLTAAIQNLAGLSIGVATADTVPVSGSGLIWLAKTQMVAAKNAGIAHLTARLRDQLARDLLDLDFQLIVDGRGVVQLVEAVVLASDDVSAIDDVRLRYELDAWILKTAFSEAACWSSGVPVVLNITTQALANPKYAELVRTAASAVGVSLNRVVLELQETHDLEQAVQSLSGLRSLGLRIAISGFGSGYTSLTGLQRLRPELIKVHADFVARAGQNPAQSAFARAAAALAHVTNSLSVAVGVETDMAFEALHRLGFGLFQGRLMGGPMQAGELRSLLETGRVQVPTVKALPRYATKDLPYSEF
jgi:EAL domain-containing protein (putative c-di-GMP-specific phosphodiesterase class I)